MRKIVYDIPLDSSGCTIYKYLKYTNGLSTKLIVKLKGHEDGIILNGLHARTIDKLNPGDILEINIRDNESGGRTECLYEHVDVLYESTDVIVYNKPSGMPCHPSKNHQGDTLANVYAARLEKNGDNGLFRCICRLDRDTTGAVVVAKNRYAAASLDRKVKKEYLAIVQGVFEEKSGVIEAPIYRPDPMMTLRSVDERGQYAKTIYDVLGQRDGYSIVKCILETGRTHQIRVHMKSIGHTLLGDDMYAGDRKLIDRQALHCMSVSFPDPESGKIIHIEAPIFEDMKRLL